MAHRVRFRSVSSVKSLRARSAEKGLNNTINKVNGSVVLAQEREGRRATNSNSRFNSRKSSATRPINILNSSAYSLHSSLSAALSRKRLANIEERGSRNNSNGYKSKASSFKASAGVSQDQLNLSSCLK